MKFPRTPTQSVLGVALFLLAATSACSTDPTADAGYQARTRRHVIAIEEVAWDYAPQAMNMNVNRPFNEDEAVFAVAGPDRIGSRYTKAVYREYTDESLAVPVADPAAPERGVLGPVLRAVVGDELEVVVVNRTSIPYSIHPHGVRYEREHEGAGPVGPDGLPTDGDAIPPGGSHTYRWEVPASAGPGPSDPSSIVWLYHSHVSSVADTNAGLVGAIVVTDPAFADDDARPIDVDREVVSLFAVHDENVSHYLEQNAAAMDKTEVELDALLEDEGFVESNLMHGVNGFIYGNGPVPTVRVGDRVRWYLLGMGTEVDLHTPHWHGNTVLDEGRRSDVVELLPASMKTVDMIADNPGVWMYHCHVNDHIAAGMVGRYRVEP